MIEKEFRLTIAGLACAFIVWALLEGMELRWHLRGIYGELDDLRRLQSRCRFLRAETARETAAAPVSERAAGSFTEADIIDIPWRAPERASAPGGKGTL